MLAKESGSSEFDLPEEVLELLPSDPLEQLDVARKIRSLTLSTREGLVKERAVLSNTEEAEQRCIEAEENLSSKPHVGHGEGDVSFSALPPSRSSSVQSTFCEAGSRFHEDRDTNGRTRVDGKEFFRQVRSRLSYEQFSAFLENVKELNRNKQTKEETLQKADEIFGPDNKDLYAILIVKASLFGPKILVWAKFRIVLGLEALLKGRWGSSGSWAT
nr:uncharacterized protein At4g15545-like [Malus domestica]